MCCGSWENRDKTNFLKKGVTEVGWTQVVEKKFGTCHGEEHLAEVLKEGKVWMKKGFLERENPRQRDNNVHSGFGKHTEEWRKHKK